jgi:hypothetical protein
MVVLISDRGSIYFGNGCTGGLIEALKEYLLISDGSSLATNNLWLVICSSSREVSRRTRKERQERKAYCGIFTLLRRLNKKEAEY